jgi:predicted aspartyl protease
MKPTIAMSTGDVMRGKPASRARVSMQSACLLLIMTGVLAGGSGTVLPARRVAHVLILQEVYLNAAGPFRMMVDTGNASSLVRPSVARRLGLTPSGSVEQVSPAGKQRVPVAVLREVRTGPVVNDAVEVMIAEPCLPEIDGVLGQSWLLRHDYLVDLQGGRLVLDGAPPAGGIRTLLRSEDGVPAIAAEVDGRRRTLALDSGSPAVVLFEAAPLLRTSAFVTTNAGRAPAAVGTALVAVGGSPPRRLPALRLETAGRRGGLLPACEFASVYVSNREGFVVLVR